MSLAMSVCISCAIVVCIHFIKNGISELQKWSTSLKTRYDKEGSLLFDSVQFPKLSVTHPQDELSCPSLMQDKHIQVRGQSWCPLACGRVHQADIYDHCLSNPVSPPLPFA